MTLKLSRKCAAIITAAAVAVSAGVAAPQAVAQTQTNSNPASAEGALETSSSGTEGQSLATGGVRNSEEAGASSESGEGANGASSESKQPFNLLYLLAGAVGIIILGDLILSAVNAAKYTTIFSR